jgi:hypothetical protein
VPPDFSVRRVKEAAGRDKLLCDIPSRLRMSGSNLVC